MSGQIRGSGEDCHSPADSEDDTDSASNSSNDGRAQVGVAPPLGQHEKYHVFFCYSNADAPWVKDIIQKLESDEFGFRCCFHERDFTPGMPIIENIVRSIQRSRKTVFVLSRDFVASRWCTYEMQMVMRRHLSEGEKLVIPVMLRECDLPEFVQHMTYLEEWTPYFLDKFIGALKESTSDDPSNQSNSFSTFTYNSNYINGEHVHKIEATCACCRPCTRFDDQIVPTELTSKGIHIPRNEYLTVIDKVMETGKMGYHTCCFSDWCFWCTMTAGMGVLYFWCMFILMVYFGGLDNSVAARAFVPIGLILLVAFPSRYISRYKMNRAMSRKVVEVNAILIKYHLFASVTDEWSCYAKPVIHFVYYETGPCLMQILGDLMARTTSDSPSLECEGASSGSVPIEVDAAAPLLSEGSSGDVLNTGDNSSPTSRMPELKAEAEALLLKYSDLYVRLLVTRKLPQPRWSRRHTQQGACLCQLVEMHEFGWKLDREEPSVV
uniref:TIRB n=1 Tax=Branchiostoma belcheri tsingtauense TaxID=155462 RepID=A0A0A0UEG1_BRABE|nr:TIRB [Branchiostoma belcheri tsingtauense]